MLFTVTQIEGNEGVLERCHYINISGDTETDVLYKFSFPVLFSVHLIFFFLPNLLSCLLSWCSLESRILFPAKANTYFTSNKNHWNKVQCFPTFSFFIISSLFKISETFLFCLLPSSSQNWEGNCILLSACKAWHKFTVLHVQYLIKMPYHKTNNSYSCQGAHLAENGGSGPNGL